MNLEAQSSIFFLSCWETFPRFCYIHLLEDICHNIFYISLNKYDLLVYFLKENVFDSKLIQQNQHWFFFTSSKEFTILEKGNN